MKGSRLLLTACIVFGSWCALFAAEDPMFIRGIRPLGMGGAFVAIADDRNAFFYNPAGMTQRQGSQFTVIDMPVSINEHSIDIYNFYNDNESKLKNFDHLTSEESTKLLNEINNRMIGRSARVSMGVPLPNMNLLSKTGRVSWGAGLFNQERFAFQFNPPVVIPTVSLEGHADVGAIVPLAYRFEKIPYAPGTVSVGAALKYIYRGKIEEKNKSVLEFDKFDPVIQKGKGYGADLGALYQPNTRWNIGLQVSDIGGTSLSFDQETSSRTTKAAYTGMIEPVWNVGVAFIPSKIYYWPNKSFSTRDRLILACDVRDFMSTDERVTDATFFKKLHMGAEFRWGPMSLRSGISSGYPSFGAGLRAPHLGFRIEYAYWADELGRFAGQLPDWNHQITIAFSWGDSKGRAYGSSVKAPAGAEAAVVEAKSSINPAAKSVGAARSEANVQAQAINQETTVDAVTSITTDTGNDSLPEAAQEIAAESKFTNKDQEPTNAN